ncbi:MAG TPA: hypothetical protein VK501_16325 [Baekduia sp.]|uniref:hypothetical protein n=1 Tax=Baekduia sp. TaxID=2600305 RepID=UPI002C22284D|nr:hypothetical protein [Baekduia sp.]HMJ35476.1 hypothetical protein [Baekduia sp.]
MLSRKSTLVAVVCIMAVAGPCAGAAFAGEITGNGKPTAGPAHANSICVFSGKNDNPSAPLDNPDAGGVSQSYGQLVRLGVIENFFGATPKTFNPGDTCRGGSNVPE